MRGLTHRRVEQRAGLAQGSAKYYFGSSEALIEAVLDHLSARDLPLVLEVSPAERAAAADGHLDGLQQRAEQISAVMLSRSDEARARFQIYLYASGRPRLQAMVAAARDRFADTIAESLPGPGSEAAARFVCAVIDGILLDQLSAPNLTVAQHAGHYLLAAGAAGAQIAAETGT